MEENSVISDAIRLVQVIQNSLLPEDKWTIVNIAKDKRASFVLDGYPSIPTSFGYNYDKTLLLLQKHGVIVDLAGGWWFVGISNIPSYWTKYIRPNLTIVNDIEWTAHDKGYLAKDKCIEYYYDEHESTGPKKHGQAAVLINVKNLNKFLTKFCNDRFIKAPSDRDHWYEHKKLNFRLTDGSTDDFDFSTADVLRKTFETFWELWIGDGVGGYTRQQIIEKYNQLFKDKELHSGLIGDRVGNIRRTILNTKPLIKNRVEWRFDFKEKIWVFKIFDLQNKS